MSVTHWAVLDIEQILTKNGYRIVATSDIPSHLFLRKTVLQPWAHKKAVTERGYTFMGDVRYCFDSYDDDEQDEPDDTIIHTFDEEPWPGCETRYFYFHGTIAGESTPSTTGIFKTHRPIKANYLFFTEPWTYFVTNPPPYLLYFCEKWPSTFTPPGDVVFYEPWGTYLTENNPWKYLQDPPQCQLSFADGIITITNEGHFDCGIDYSPLVNVPLESPTGKPIHILLGVTNATISHSTTRIGIAGYFHHPVEGIMYFVLWIALGSDYIASCPFGTAPPPPWPQGWYCIGTGLNDIDLLSLWKQWRTDLGKGIDPTDWTLTNWHFGLGVEDPVFTDHLKSDYLILYYPP